MNFVANLKIGRPKCLPGPGQASPMGWDLVPDQLQLVLRQEGCLLLKHWVRKRHEAYIRFQYAPLTYQGALFYLQRWSATEWHVSPSQLIFPNDGWPCNEETLRHGSQLSILVRQAISLLYPEPILSFSNAG